MEQTIIAILKNMGVYEQARTLVKDDSELIEMFRNDFLGLIERALAQQ
jgi:hypothetical protein